VLLWVKGAKFVFYGFGDQFPGHRRDEIQRVIAIEVTAEGPW
jgi:hypothetical protein